MKVGVRSLDSSLATLQQIHVTIINYIIL